MSELIFEAFFVPNHLQFISIHHTTLHYTALHYTTLHGYKYLLLLPMFLFYSFLLIMKEKFVLTIGLTNEHGQYFEDTVPVRSM